MPAYGVPQSLMYGYRGRMADGNMVRNRGAEQRFSGSGNPQMPIFNTAPSPVQGTTQTMPVGTDPYAGAGRALNRLRARGGPVGRQALMPQLGDRLGVQGGGMAPPGPNGLRSDAASPLMWQGHQVTPDQYAQIQAINARTARLRAGYGNPSPTPLGPPTTAVMPQFTS